MMLDSYYGYVTRSVFTNYARLGYFHLSLRDTGSLTLRMSNMLVLWTFLSGTLLEETSSQVIIHSNFGRIAESGSGILRKE